MPGSFSARTNPLIWTVAQVTYINAPNRASGPIPEDVAPFFKGPYYE